jgi:glutamate-1-semialdehyde 2,1-aminomutase
LEQGLRQAAATAGVAHQLARVGSMMTLFFGNEPVVDWPSASRCDTKRFARWFWGMLERGAYLPCSQYEALFVSAAHKEADIDATITAAGEALAARSC